MCNSLQILREYIPPHDFPVEQEHSGPGKVWRYLFLKVFHGRLRKIYGRDLEGGRGGVVLHGGLKTKGGGVSQIHFLVIILHFSNHEVTYT